MPPSGKLPEAIIQIILEWIASGALKIDAVDNIILIQTISKFLRIS